MKSLSEQKRIGSSCSFYKKVAFSLLLFLLIGCSIGILVPAGLGWDFANFYDTGRRVSAGLIQDIYNPDSLIHGENPQGPLSFWGTPLSAWLYVPLSGFPPETALLIFKIQNTIFYFGGLGILYWSIRRFVENTPTAQWHFAALFVGLSFLYQPFWAIYRVGGQTTPTVFLLFCLALVAHTRGRFWVSSWSVVLAVMIKPVFAIGLVFLLIVSERRFLVATTGALMVTGLASLSLMGWNIHQEFIQKVLQKSAFIYSWKYNSSVYIFIRHLQEQALEGSFLNVHAWVFPVATMGIKLGVVVLFIYVMRKSRFQEWMPDARNHFAFLMAIMFSLLVAQTVWEHYLAMLFIPLMYFVVTQKDLSKKAKTVLGGIFLTSIGQNVIFASWLDMQLGDDSLAKMVLVCLIKSAPLLLLLVFLSRHYREWFSSYRVQGWNQAPTYTTAAS